MHTRSHRLGAVAAMTLALAILIPQGAGADRFKQGGRRGGSFNSLNGDPSIGPLMTFQLKAYDPDLFLATCIDPVEAATNGTPGTVCQTLLGGFDHVAAGVGLRHAGFGTIGLRGAPTGATVISAHLLWSVIGDTALATGTDGLSMEVGFQGQQVSGTRVGEVMETCWETGGHAIHYSADVTHLVPEAINGDYQIAGLPSSVTDGRNPLHDSQDPPLPWAEGASLTVVYTHPNATGRVYYHEGAALLIDSLDLSLDLSPPLESGNATVIRHTRIGGDGQTWDGGPILPYITLLGNDLINPTDIQIRGPGSAFDPSSDWQGQDGAPVPGLWDTQSDELWQTLAGPEIDNYTVRWMSVSGGGVDSGGQAASAMVFKAAAPEPPPQEAELYDCVYIGAVVMTTSR
ncbi:MAG: hypothetical protein AAF657_38425 [Acidobacteriota bacterium]